jgi:ribosomal protein L29
MAKKAKKANELAKLSDADLKKQLGEAYKRMFSLNLQAETLQLHNHRQIPATRKEIARIKTQQRLRELAKGGR